MAIPGEDGNIKIAVQYVSDLESHVKKADRLLNRMKAQYQRNLDFIAEREGTNNTKSLRAIKAREIANVKLLNGMKAQTMKLTEIHGIEQKIVADKQQQLALEKSLARASSKTAQAKKSQEQREFERGFGGAIDQGVGTTFGHKFATTAQYATAGVIIGGAFAAVGTAARDAAGAILEFDLQTRTMAAAMDLSLGKANELGNELLELSTVYGGTTESIFNASLALGRAGIETDKVTEATEIVLRMARLTGDTFEQSSKAIISYQQVFGDTNSIQELGDKLAFVANVSRLSTQDIGTFSNFALAAAKSVGLTVDAVGGLAAAFSNAGVNASTIGTQIRRFTSLLRDDTTDVTRFFDNIGVSQKNLLNALQSDTETSNEAMIDFIEVLRNVDDSNFNNLLGGMDILASNVLSLMRNNSSNIQLMIRETAEGVEGQLKNTDVILQSYVVTWESAWNTVKKLAVDAWNSDIIEGVSSGIKTLTFDLAQLTDVLNPLTGKESALKLQVIEQIQKLNKELETVTDESKIASIRARMLDLHASINPTATDIPSKPRFVVVLEEIAQISKQLEGTKSTKVIKLLNDAIIKLQKEYDSITTKQAQVSESRFQESKRTTLDIKQHQQYLQQLGTIGKLKLQDVESFGTLVANNLKIVQGTVDNIIGGARRDGLDPALIGKLSTIAKSQENSTQRQLHFANLLNEVEAARGVATGERKRELDDIFNIIQTTAKADAASIELDNAKLSVARSLKAQEQKISEEKEKQTKAENSRLARVMTLQNQVDALLVKQYEAVNLIPVSQNADLEKIRNATELLRIKGLITTAEEDSINNTLKSIEVSRQQNVGLQAGINEYIKSVGTLNERLENIAVTSLQSLQSGMTSFFDVSSEGFLDFKQLASSVLQDITRQLLQQLVIKQIVSGIAGGFSGGGGGEIGVSTFGSFSQAQLANGGMVDGTPTQGFANGGLLKGGSGVRDDLFLGKVNGVATFAMGGEFITKQSSVNPNTRAGLDHINKTGEMPGGNVMVNTPVTINIENQTGQDIEADMIQEMTKQNSKGEEEKIISVVLKKARTDLNFRNAIRGGV